MTDEAPFSEVRMEVLHRAGSCRWDVAIGNKNVTAEEQVVVNVGRDARIPGEILELDGSPYNVCKHCRQFMEKRFYSMQQRSWNKLPKLLDLDVPDWAQGPVEDLTSDSEDSEDVRLRSPPILSYLRRD